MSTEALVDRNRRVRGSVASPLDRRPLTQARDFVASMPGQLDAPIDQGGTPYRRIVAANASCTAAIGMPADHPELVTRWPGRGEWRQFTAWLAEVWPNDEYTAIVTGAWR
jgi:hypothetical protein